MTLEAIISVFLGIGLAASVGFRVFLPLFALSLASYFNIIPLNENWGWIGNTAALLILGVATFLEIFVKAFFTIRVYSSYEMPLGLAYGINSTESASLNKILIRSIDTITTVFIDLIMF